MQMVAPMHGYHVYMLQLVETVVIMSLKLNVETYKKKGWEAYYL